MIDDEPLSEEKLKSIEEAIEELKTGHLSRIIEDMNPDIIQNYV